MGSADFLFPDSLPCPSTPSPAVNLIEPQRLGRSHRQVVFEKCVEGCQGLLTLTSFDIPRLNDQSARLEHGSKFSVGIQEITPVRPVVVFIHTWLQEGPLDVVLESSIQHLVCDQSLPKTSSKHSKNSVAAVSISSMRSMIPNRLSRSLLKNSSPV
jgi:hypothetical protein